MCFRHILQNLQGLAPSPRETFDEGAIALLHHERLADAGKDTRSVLAGFVVDEYPDLLAGGFFYPFTE